MLGQQYIADHRDEARQSYLDILKAIADEFEDKRFLLIFDQFESVGKASIDLFLNFVKFLQPEERFYIIVSFRTDDTTWNDPSTTKIYEDLQRKLTYELDAKKITLEGLSAEDTGKWIKQVRGISLPLNPDLQRIKESSAGLPLLLEEWIGSSKDLKDYDNIKRDKLCTQIIGLGEGLDEQDQVRLDRLSILVRLGLLIFSVIALFAIGFMLIYKTRELLGKASIVFKYLTALGAIKLDSEKFSTNLRQIEDYLDDNDWTLAGYWVNRTQKLYTEVYLRYVKQQGTYQVFTMKVITFSSLVTRLDHIKKSLLALV